jgi:hypothetical protein
MQGRMVPIKWPINNRPQITYLPYLTTILTSLSGTTIAFTICLPSV